MRWKQLSTPNAWLFVIPAKVKIAIICDGVREEITVNCTGIIEISPNCIIKTNKNILSPKKLELARVLNNNFYPARIGTIDTFNITSYKPQDKQEEPVITASNSLEGRKKEEEQIHEQLEDKKWATFRHHTLIGSTTAFSVTTIALAACVIYFLYQRYKNNKHPQRPQHRNSMDNGIPLQPLHLYNDPSIAQEDN